MNMTNLYGTIVSNVICGLIGGAGLLSGANYGDHVSGKSIRSMILIYRILFKYCFSSLSSNLARVILVQLLLEKILPIQWQ